MTDQTDDEIAKQTLRDICRDPTAAPAARASAARTLAEMSGAIGRHAEPPKKSKDITEMSLDELEAEADGS